MIDIPMYIGRTHPAHQLQRVVRLSLQIRQPADRARTVAPPPPRDVSWPEIGGAILRCDGSFVSARVVTRRHQRFPTAHIVRAMQLMSRPRDHVDYIGEYRELHHNIKVFYKCPPVRVREQALLGYGIGATGYAYFYHRSAQPLRGGPFDWRAYHDFVLAQSPYAAIDDATLLPGQ